METRQNTLAIIEAHLAAFRVWIVGFVVDCVDLLGDGATARAWRAWARAELNDARADLKVLLVAMAVAVHGVPESGGRPLHLHAPPNGFARARCRASVRMLTRQFQWRSCCVRARLARLWRWLSDPGAYAAAIARRLARGLKRLAIVARRPPACPLAPHCAPEAASADTS